MKLNNEQLLNFEKFISNSDKIINFLKNKVGSGEINGLLYTNQINDFIQSYDELKKSLIKP